MSKRALKRAVKLAGGQAQLAAAIAESTGRPVSRQQVYNWLNRDRGIPPEFAPAIEAATGVTRQELCPRFPW